MRKITGIFRNDWKRLKTPLAVIGIYFIITMRLFENVCPFYIFCGVPCPGCGLTRAGIALLCGKWEAAARQNAMIYLWVPLLLSMLYRHYIERKTEKRPEIKWIALILVGLISMIYYVWRMRYVFPDAPMEFRRNNLLHDMIVWSRGFSK